MALNEHFKKSDSWKLNPTKIKLMGKLKDFNLKAPTIE